MPARLFAAPLGAISGEIGVAEAILDASLARYRPHAAAHPCREQLLAAEAEARTAPTPLMPSCRQAITLRLPLRAQAWCSSKARRRASARPPRASI
jgi:hypothetical protein